MEGGRERVRKRGRERGRENDKLHTPTKHPAHVCDLPRLPDVLDYKIKEQISERVSE